MATLNMGTMHSFSRENIKENVEENRIGNYALGYKKDGSFIVQYVGRSDTDLRGRLLQHIGEGYEYYKFSYASSKRDAFSKECQNYHDFGGDEGKLKNDYHPDEPEGASWKCPVCG